MRETLTVYYDGACPLCRTEIAHYRGCAGAERVSFVDLAPVETDAPLGPGLTCAAARARFHVRDADGRLSSGAAAFARLWFVLPAWRWLGRIVGLRVFGFRPILPVAEAAYRLFLPLRPRLARLLILARRFLSKSRETTSLRCHPRKARARLRPSKVRNASTRDER